MCRWVVRNQLRRIFYWELFTSKLQYNQTNFACLLLSIFPSNNYPSHSVIASEPSLPAWLRCRRLNDALSPLCAHLSTHGREKLHSVLLFHLQPQHFNNKPKRRLSEFTPHNKAKSIFQLLMGTLCLETKQPEFSFWSPGEKESM